ncbi:MAG: aminotransferase class V-fold PLP-dependent enzyme [Chitinophagaceae bacterium]|nr:aminotransferase class V-fold PLP-dependent enzyme [Chitinophagaceae bacterium]
MEKNELLTALEALDSTSRQLDIDETERSAMMQAVTAYANQFLSSLKDAKAFAKNEVGDLSIQSQTYSLSQILTIFQNEVAANGINAASGTHLGYIPGGGLFASAIADFLAAVSNTYASVHYASPGAATMENEVINWLKNIFGFPASAVGCLSSGGSISTLIAFTAARDRHGIKNEKVPNAVVYLSEQVHHSTQKALRIIGLGDVVIRTIALDKNHRMQAPELNAAIEKDKASGLQPFLIVSSSGTTDTGAIDPLDAIADIAIAQGCWHHVDAAYGGFFILTSKKDKFKGIEKADSLIVDPHKGMFLPYGVGAVLVKDSEAVLQSNYYAANYMQDVSNETLLKSSANLSPELTKHFRGLRVWLPLQLHGIQPFIACLEEKILLTAYFRMQLQELGFCLGPEPDLSVSYFWYPFPSDTDAKNKALMAAIHRDGSVFLSSSMIDGRFVIRMAILTFRTKKSTIDKAVEMIKNCLQKIL